MRLPCDWYICVVLDGTGCSEYQIRAKSCFAIFLQSINQSIVLPIEFGYVVFSGFDSFAGSMNVSHVRMFFLIIEAS